MSEVYFFLLARILHVELLQVIYQLHLLANGALKLVLLQEMKTLAGENQSRQRQATTKRMVALCLLHGQATTKRMVALCLLHGQATTKRMVALCLLHGQATTKHMVALPGA